MRLALLFLPLLTTVQVQGLGADSDHAKALHDRRVPLLPGLISVVDAVVGGLVDSLIDLANQEDKECRFVGELIALLSLQYEDMNVIVYHDLDSDRSGLHEKTCYEKTVPRLFEDKVYAICIFDEGRFVRSGDGGCRNWGFNTACAARTSDVTVNFCPRTAEVTATTTSPDQEPPETVITTSPITHEDAVVTTTSTTKSEGAAVTTTSLTPSEDPAGAPVSTSTPTPTPTSTSVLGEEISTSEPLVVVPPPPPVVENSEPAWQPTQVITTFIVTQGPELAPTTQLVTSVLIPGETGSIPQPNDVPGVQGNGGVLPPGRGATETKEASAPMPAPWSTVAVIVGIAGLYLAFV